MPKTALERAKQLYDDTGGPGNQGAIWKILGLLIEYLVWKHGRKADSEPSDT